MSRIKRYFASGLLITIPVFITLYLIYVVARFIDNIWGKLINMYFMKHFGFTVPGVGLILGIITIFAVGFVATNFIGKRIFKGAERWFLRFPLIRQIYPAMRQIVDSLMSKEGQAFKKVILVEYPSKGIWAVGFLTGDSFAEANLKTGRDLVHVFVATTPNPLTGFLVLVPRDEIRVMDISIEDGIKLIVSGGIVKPL